LKLWQSVYKGGNVLTTLDVRDGAAWITMDDGKVNAMSLAMLRDIEVQFENARRQGGPVVLKGRKGIFSAGFDLKTFERGRDASRQMVKTGVRVIQEMLAFPRPIVAACTGHAYPMGAFLMLAADVRFGVMGDWKIGLNEVAIGLAVPQFAVELARYRLAPAGVMRVSTGAMVGPEEAARLGYLDYVVRAEELDTAIRDEMRRLQKLDAKSYELTKERLNRPILAAIAEASAQL
jgi:enoyl-CoA hydratase